MKGDFGVRIGDTSKLGTVSYDSLSHADRPRKGNVEKEGSNLTLVLEKVRQS